jgi:hypothetical protein
MTADPFDGQSFVLPKAICTPERRAWFRRSNEIMAFMMTTSLALKECGAKYEAKIPSLSDQGKTPLRIDLKEGLYIAAPARLIVQKLKEGVDILTRQIFVMFYGSFETYLFDLMIRSFGEIGKSKDPLQNSIKIMMGKSWKSKFAKIDSTFDLNHKDRNLITHFKDFQMEFLGMKFKNPLDFIDKLSEIRHRIVHASSIIDVSYVEKYPQVKSEKGKPITIEITMFHPMYAFYTLLTEYIDELFGERFGYHRVIIDPASA